MSDVWRLAGSVPDVHCGREVGLCVYDGSICKHVNHTTWEAHCWTVFGKNGVMRVCSHLDVLRCCEQLAEELRSKGVSQ